VRAESGVEELTPMMRGRRLGSPAWMASNPFLDVEGFPDDEGTEAALSWKRLSASR
jgi:hypothetical protein